MSFDRYSKFRHNGEIGKVPFIEIPERNSDRYEKYILGRSRLDRISYQYYGDCDYGWLIMQANPSYGSIEYLIPDGSMLRIPYPLEIVLSKYCDDIDYYNKYGTSA